MKLTPVYFIIGLLLVSMMIAPHFASGQTETVIYEFTGQYNLDGRNPASNLLVDSAGNLYGTTSAGGFRDHGAGTVFQLTPAGSGIWTESILYRFTGGLDGGVPAGNIVMDNDGNIYGTAEGGGAFGGGTVVELSPPKQPGGAWAGTVLYSFDAYNGADGSAPRGGVILDSFGNLYGTTYMGGSHAYGAVFELSPPNAVGLPWTETVLYSFEPFRDGGHPVGGVVMGKDGNLYGTTSQGGRFNKGGTIFQLAQQAGVWQFTVLHSFGGAPADGASPQAALAVNGFGALIGTTNVGGSANLGTVFALENTSGGWEYEVLYSFLGAPDGEYPVSSVTLGNRVLYGTTANGGTQNDGTIFELIPPFASGDGWKERILHSFRSIDGYSPDAPLLIQNGALYGTTYYGGDYLNDCRGVGCGTVFTIAPRASSAAESGASWPARRR